jgi:hypothetical protein
MVESAAFSGRPETLAGPLLAAEREAFDVVELLTEMVIVEACISGAGQAKNRQADPLRRAGLDWRVPTPPPRLRASVASTSILTDGTRDPAIPLLLFP